MDLPDGSRMLGVHVAPGMNDLPGLHPLLSDSELEQLVSDASADLVRVGHTHKPLDRQVNGVRVVNTGSVSNPHPDAADRRSSYVVLNARSQGYEVQHRRVGYDYDRVIAVVEASHHPARAYISRHYAPGAEASS